MQPSYKHVLCSLAMALALATCYQHNMPLKIILPRAEAFADSIDGRPTSLFVLKNQAGMQAAFTTYGGRLVCLIVPDAKDNPTSVVMGFDSVRQYQTSTEPYFGATIGRYGNRIAGGRFILENTTYTLPINKGPSALYGDKRGFHDKVWNAIQPDDSTLILLCHLVDGEYGLPGNVDIQVRYALIDGKGLKITYDATTDRSTVLDLTNHAIFNLNGEGTGSILDHTLQINADVYTPVDSTLIPTGVFAPVHGTPFDFTTPTAIGKNIAARDTQLQYGKGYDHHFVCRGTGFRKVATAVGNLSGIHMEVWTDQPSLQFYSGNLMESKNRLRVGRDDFRTAFCLEPQHFPNSPNQLQFSGTVLQPGQPYHTETTYLFTHQ